MSNPKNDSTVPASEETHDGTILDGTDTAVKEAGPIRRFLVKYKTALIATGAAAAGFVAAGFLSGSSDDSCEYVPEDEDITPEEE